MKVLVFLAALILAGAAEARPVTPEVLQRIKQICRTTMDLAENDVRFRDCTDALRQSWAEATGR